MVIGSLSSTADSDLSALSSIVMTVSGGPTLLGLPVFGLLGFLGAVAGSLWLLLSILRSGRGR
jgi:ubiquinone biosynthesis protein